MTMGAMGNTGKTHPKKHAVAVRFSKFLFVFDLRQGAILIAVQNIAIAGCTLIMLLVGIAHALETMNTLNADMEDDAEREEAVAMAAGVSGPSGDDRDSPPQITNNQKKFRVAYHLAIMMIFFLYSSLVGATVYLIFSIGLFYGAAKNKKEYVLPWIIFAVFIFFMLAGALYVGDKSDTVIRICGGHSLYGFGCSLVIFGYIYCIVTVASYAYELYQRDAKKRAESSALANIDVCDKHLLITKESIKIPYDRRTDGVNFKANHV